MKRASRNSTETGGTNNGRQGNRGLRQRRDDVPVIDGIAFLTGAGQKQQYDKLVQAIKDFQG